MKLKNILLPILLALCVAAILLSPKPRPPVFAHGDLAIRTAQGERRFSIEIATTPAQLSYGLMYRREMARNHGMIFLFSPDQDIHMWMKNTVLPLDMLFVDRQGRIVHIAADAVPYSETNISAGQPVRAVIELLGGTAAQDGIHEDDTVIYPGLQP